MNKKLIEGQFIRICRTSSCNIGYLLWLQVMTMESMQWQHKGISKPQQANTVKCGGGVLKLGIQ